MKTKNVIISLIFLFSSLFVVSQKNLQVFDHHNQMGKSLYLKNFLSNKTLISTDSSRWYNYGQTMEYFSQGTSYFNINYLFPDSTILVNNNGSFSGPRIHKIADIFMPYADVFNDNSLYLLDLHINANQSYILDSIEVYGFYRQKLISVTDTLLIQISVKPNSSGYTYFGPNSPIAINLGVDTVKFRPLNYNQMSNKFGEAITWQIKVPLTATTVSDSVEYGISVIRVAPNLIIPANSYVISNVEFIPGYSWLANQDSITSKNYFQFLSIDENPGQFPLYTKDDYNCSYILPIDVRYNNTGSWNGKYKPSFAYMDSSYNNYKYTHHLIYYKASLSSYLATENLEREKALIIYPNPATDYLNIEGQNLNFTFEICNILGEKIQLGNLTNRIDISDFVSGIYFLTIYDKNKRIVKKEKIVKQ